MLAQRLRRCPNIEPAKGERVALAGRTLQAVAHHDHTNLARLLSDELNVFIISVEWSMTISNVEYIYVINPKDNNVCRKPPRF